MKRILEEEIACNDNNPIITINTGGCIISTFKSTLTKSFPGSVLATMFSDKHFKSLKLDEKGHYFIDSDGMIFSKIIHYLRRSIPFDVPPKDVDEDLWFVELDYWGLSTPKITNNENIKTGNNTITSLSSIDDIINDTIIESNKRIEEVMKLLLSLSGSIELIKKGASDIDIYVPVREESYMLPWGDYIGRFIAKAIRTMRERFGRYSSQYQFYIDDVDENVSMAQTHRINYKFNDIDYNTCEHYTYKIIICIDRKMKNVM